MVDHEAIAVELPTTLRDQIEQAVAARIVAGVHEAGEVLSVPTLVSVFGVSATPVREALLALERRGMLVSLRNRGFRVTEVSAEQLQQIADVRKLLECPPMREVAGAVPEGTAVRLASLADRLEVAATEQRLGEYLELDTEFHLTIIDLAGNPHLTQRVRELRSQTRLSGLALLAESGALLETAREHRALLDLLVAGDGIGAEALMRRHIGHVTGSWARGR